MKLKSQTALEISRDQWMNYIDKHPDATFFHTPFIYDVFDDMPNLKPFALFTLDEKDNIRAMLTGFRQNVKTGLLYSISSRAVIPQSPIYNDKIALTFLLEKYKEIYSKDVVYCEIHNHIIDEKVKDIYMNSGYVFNPHLNYIVDCRDKEVVLSRFSKSKKRQINKSVKAGAIIVQNPTQKQLKEFYNILKNLYDNTVKKPIFDFSFFEKLDKINSEKFYVKFLLVEYKNKIIGGIVAPVSDDVIHEYYIAGLDRDYKNIYPSVMATWAAIDYACNNGLTEFDFMGAGSPNKDYGVRDFKAKFGGKLIKPGRYQLIHSPLMYKIAETGFTISQKIKRIK
jgi:serine/alanine adding enzyme